MDIKKSDKPGQVLSLLGLAPPGQTHSKSVPAVLHTSPVGQGEPWHGPATSRENNIKIGYVLLIDSIICT